VAAAAAIVVYATVAGDRLPQVIAGVGAAGCALIALAFVVRRSSVFPVGLAAVGAAYGVYLSLRSGPVDVRAPLVAAVLFLAAELGYSSLGRTEVRSERRVVARRVAELAIGAVLTGVVGSLLLALTTGVGGGISLEAAGVAAAALTLGAIAALASRASV
jgi:predicted PurR-regulated permease PerM